MNRPDIWIDADSCPTSVRNFVLKYCAKKELSVTFVANKEIPAKTENYKMVICNNEKDAADNYIYNNVKENDLVITRDIVFAARLVDKNITVINDRGTSFTKRNIENLLADRNLDFQLAQIGITGIKSNSFDRKKLTKFINCFDKEISKLLKNQ